MEGTHCFVIEESLESNEKRERSRMKSHTLGQPLHMLESGPFTSPENVRVGTIKRGLS